MFPSITGESNSVSENSPVMPLVELRRAPMLSHADQQQRRRAKRVQ
jgi:hypothetical protein